ncbi:hypothetical protein BDV10DRAFT_190123 [Aspergillus recurvatus]
MRLIFSTDYLRDTFGTNVEIKGHQKVFELRAVYDAVLPKADVLITPIVLAVAFEFPPGIKEGAERGILGRGALAIAGLDMLLQVAATYEAKANVVFAVTEINQSGVSLVANR